MSSECFVAFNSSRTRDQAVLDILSTSSKNEVLRKHYLKLLEKEEDIVSLLRFYYQERPERHSPQTSTAFQESLIQAARQGSLGVAAKALDAAPITGRERSAVPQLHSLLAQCLAQEPGAEDAELQAAAARFQAQPSLTFLPLLTPASEPLPLDFTPPASMAAGKVQASTLPGVLEELGYACTQSGPAFQDVLRQVSTVDEAAVAAMLSMMIRTHDNLDDPHGTQASLNNLLGLRSTDGAEAKSWNVEVAVDTLKAFAPDLQPLHIAESLDHDGFQIPDQEGLHLFMKAWQKLSPEPFPLQVLLTSLWQNSAGQLSFLRQAIAAPQELFSFDHAEHQVPTPDWMNSKVAQCTPNQAWLSLDLYKTLCKLAEVGHHTAVQQLLEEPMTNCPEVVFVGMASLRTEWGVLQHEVCQALALEFVAAPQPTSAPVLRLVWTTSSNSMMRAMLALYDQDHKHLERVLDVCLEIGVLEAVLEATPFAFAIELASLAVSHSTGLNLEKWLQAQAAFHQLPFLAAVIQFVAGKLQAYSEQPSEAARKQLPPDVLAVHLRILQAHSLAGPSELAAEVSQLQHHAVRVHPELQVLIVEAAAASNTVPTPIASFPVDVEEEANMYFQKLYNIEDPENVESLTAKLRSMKNSSNTREQEIFPCMIQSLFDEYRFFPKYPDKELQITAALFGALINADLITAEKLGDALRLFLDAVRNPAGHKLCSFGIQALRPIIDRLPAWPQYCRNLLQAANLAEKDKQLGEVAERASREIEATEPRSAPPGFEQAVLSKSESQVQPETGVQLAEEALAVPGQQPPRPTSGTLAQAVTSNPRSPQQATAALGNHAADVLKVEGHTDGVDGTPFGVPAIQGAQPSGRLPGSPRANSSAQLPRPNATQAAMDHKRAFQAVNAETLELALQDINYEMPPHKVQDRIGFLINNLTNSNLKQKVNELKEHLTEEYWPWFCNYMVVKRAAQEQNYHLLYVNLLQELQLKELWRMLVATTYKYVKILLASERIKTHTSERSLLKNLGSWLGRLTIAQGQPVRHRDLDIKGIIIEAFEQGKMIAVLPFVNKVLEPCKDSKVFRPPNPWITGILSLMAEIYGTDKLKLNLTFEIEMLFRNFNLQISDTRVSKELQNRKRDTTSGTDFAVEKVASDQTAASGGLPPPSPARSIPAIQEASAPATPGPSNQFPGPSTPARASMDGGAEMRVQTTPQQQQPPALTAQQSTPQDQGLIGNYHNHVSINPSLQYMADRLNLKRMVPVAVDRAVADIITPVVERSVTIACMTTQELILKDYALEENEGSMRKAAHLMVSSLAGSLALVTCREPLRSSLATQLRHLLANTMDASQLDQTVNTITNDNFELGCTIIERSATDKAIRDINDRLGTAFQARLKAAAAGQSYFDASVLQGRFPKSLPEALRPGAGHLSPQQERVYEDFARIPKQPGAAAAATAPTGHPGGGPGSPLQAAAPDKQASLESTDGGTNYNEATLAYANISEATHVWQQQLDRFAIDTSGATYDSVPEGGKLASIVKEVVDIVPESGLEEQVQFVARKVFYHMFEIAPNSLHVQASVAALSLLKARLPGRFPTELTGLWAAMTEDRRWRKDIPEALLKARLLNGPEMDAHLHKALQISRSSTPLIEFIVHLMRSCIISERPCLTAAELYHTLEVLQKLIVPQMPSNVAFGLQQLIDNARSQHHVPAMKLNETGDPTELKDQVKRIFDEWIRLSDELPGDESFDTFVAGLQQIGFLKISLADFSQKQGDELTNRFLRIMINLAVSHSLKHESASQQPTQLSYLALDGFVRLIILLVNVHSGGVPLLERVMASLIRCLQRDAEMRSDEFNGRPYYRIILGFITEMCQGPDSLSFGLLTTIATALLSVQPLQTPSFAFPWLELISHRIFMPKLVNEQQGWPHFQKLLIALLRFLEPYLRNAELTDSVRLLYKGTLRVLLVLLHDFPEFLCEYHFEVCNAVPPSCIQMRNLILSAFPRNMRLPDPFTPNLKVDLLPEISTPPRFRPPAEHMLPSSLQTEVDNYMVQRMPASFLGSLQSRLVLPSLDVNLSGTRYNVPLLNALVFYVGIQEVKSQRQVQPGSSPVVHSPAMDIFQRMATDLDTEGRYLFLNALANQLRYPNNHTHYFSCILLYLFSEAKQEIIQEQITRVLLERLIVNRPHPWGLLITFIELIKNPRYSFWSYNFTRCAGEIERLFDSVARSCMGTGVKPEEDVQAIS